MRNLFKQWKFMKKACQATKRTVISIMDLPLLLCIHPGIIKGTHTISKKIEIRPETKE